MLSEEHLKLEEALNSPMSENELLRLEEKKCKIAFDNLVELVERKHDEIEKRCLNNFVF